MNEPDRLEMLDWLTSHVRQERKQRRKADGAGVRAKATYNKASGAIRAYQEVILYLEPEWEVDDGRG